ncbi:MAG: hypothetical protein OXQ84_19095 [bacterium]|nr:hypothetical protein [bacterium]
MCELLRAMSNFRQDTLAQKKSPIQLLDGIDKEIGVGGAAPEILTR